MGCQENAADQGEPKQNQMKGLQWGLDGEELAQPDADDCSGTEYQHESKPSSVSIRKQLGYAKAYVDVDDVCEDVHCYVLRAPERGLNTAPHNNPVAIGY